MNRLKDKVAIVTGAANGIGQASAFLMAGEGAKVVVADLDLQGALATVEKILAQGGEAIAVHLDAMSDDSIREMVAKAEENFGALHVLHNNVGGTDARRDNTVVDMDWSYWNSVIQLNLNSTVFACRCAIPLMIESGGGSIINTASMVAVQGDMRPTAYASAKGAVISFTRFVATQYGKKNIRCNVIAPGMVLSPRPVPRPEAVLDIILKHNLMPYLGQPEDIGHLAVFLASDESRYITGQLIEADGGSGCHGAALVDLVELSGGAVHTLLPVSPMSKS